MIPWARARGHPLLPFSASYRFYFSRIGRRRLLVLLRGALRGGTMLSGNGSTSPGAMIAWWLASAFNSLWIEPRERGMRERERCAGVWIRPNFDAKSSGERFAEVAGVLNEMFFHSGGDLWLVARGFWCLEWDSYEDSFGRLVRLCSETSVWMSSTGNGSWAIFARLRRERLSWVRMRFRLIKIVANVCIRRVNEWFGITECAFLRLIFAGQMFTFVINCLVVVDL